MENNNNFLGESGEVEALKKSRARKRGVEPEIKKEETPVAQDDFISKELGKFNLSDAIVEQWKKDFLPLKVESANDKEGLTKVTEAWRTVRNTRISIEKKGKELRADAIKFQKAIIGEEKRLVDQLSEIEAHLEAQKDFVEREKERIRLEKETQVQIRVQVRTSELLKLGFSFNGEVYELTAPGEEPIKIEALQVKLMEEHQFNIIIVKAQIIHERERMRREEEDKARAEEAERLAKVKAEQEAEAKRLEAIRLEQEKKEAELKAAQEKIEADKRAAEEAIAREKRELELKKQREEELEKAKVEAAAKALRDAEETRKKKEEQERIATEKKLAEEKAAEAERQRVAALAPDKEKLAIFTVSLASYLEKLQFPQLNTEAGNKLLDVIKMQNAKYAEWIKKQQVQ